MLLLWECGDLRATIIRGEPVQRHPTGPERTRQRPDSNGRRPDHGGVEWMQTDPAWKDHLLFFEDFNADNGAGLGASHQAG